MKEKLRKREKNSILKKVLAIMLVVMTFLTSIDFSFETKVSAATQNIKLFFVDNTAENWVKNDSAVLELVDNTNGHDSYIMTKENDTTWSVSVPESAYNITFNRYNSDKTVQWNSWSAGGRDENNTYYADGSEYGHWGYIEDEENYFHAGDIIYLDVSEFTEWENDEALMYVNFTEASKEENGGNDVNISSADEYLYNPRSVEGKIEDYIYVYTVTSADEGATELRFWRGNTDNLWNCSIIFNYSQYLEGQNCVKVTGWNNIGSVGYYELVDYYEKDSDKDGVLDYLEEMFGADSTKTDTDEDGLTDYEEIYVTETNPILPDSDGDVITDDSEDFDTDGIINITEIKIGTDPADDDTDNDGLKDNDEIEVYGTYPNKYDSDEDGLSDEDEYILGLNPMNTCTDGITQDTERTFEQIADIEIVDETLLVDNLCIPTISGNVSGNINKHVSVEAEDIYALDDNRAVVGKEVYVRTDYSEKTELMLSFTCTDNSVDSRYFMICKYEDGEINPCETYQSVDGVYSYVSEGFYFVMDTKQFLVDLGIPIEKYLSSEYAIASCTNDEIETSSLGKVYGQADIVFVIDSTGSMTSSINNVVANIDDFVDALTNYYGVKANFALVNYKDVTCGEETVVIKNGASNWFSDVNAFKSKVNSIYVSGGGDGPETPIDGLEVARELDFRTNANKFIILVTDADYKTYNNYGIASINEMAERLKESGICTSVIAPTGYQSIYSDLYTKTNGVYGDVYGNFSNVLIELSDKIGELVNDGRWVILSDYQYVKLDRTVGDDGYSTDSDKLSDKEELGTRKEIDLSTFIKFALMCSDIPEEVYADETSITVYKYTSNPVLPDTDYDGIDDDVDTAPMDNNFKGKLHYELEDEKTTTCNVEFSIDYKKFFKTNTLYDKDLSIMSILYATGVYDNHYIEITKGTSGGTDAATAFGTIFGLEECRNIVISGSEADYEGYDPDDVTEFVVGHREVEYKGEKREVIILSIRGTNSTNAEWSSNFDVGADTDNYYAMTGEHPYWINKSNHKGFDVTMNRVLEKYNEYIDEIGINDSSIKKSILITGHSRGAAIANLLGAHFEDDSDYQSYTYTFASPFTTTDNEAENYQTIFNVMNKDDIITYLPLESWGFKKYGIMKTISVEESYEDSNPFGDKKGTFEWLIGEDYNNDGGTKRTIECFNAIADSREELYEFDLSSDGKVNIGNKYHVTNGGAKERKTEVEEMLDEVKLLRFTNVSIEKTGVYYVEVNYCPAYLMQNIANMASHTGPNTGYDTKGKYREAKVSFIASSGRTGVKKLGGMAHPHMQPTYYLIACNNFKKL